MIHLKTHFKYVCDEYKIYDVVLKFTKQQYLTALGIANVKKGCTFV